jgi:hypothetical protein
MARVDSDKRNKVSLSKEASSHLTGIPDWAILMLRPMPSERARESIVP